MDILADGTKVNMTADDVFATFDDIDLETDGHLKWDYETDRYYEYFCASCFGPVVDHEIHLFTSIYDALKWVKDSIGNKKVSEMCHLCWKDIYDTGTEWEIRKIELP